MKRIGNLFDQVISIDNLTLASHNARKGKREHKSMRLFDKNREANIEKLQQALRDRTFHTSPYHVFPIMEKKERMIYSLPYYPDRIVHHALMQVLMPIWEKVFTYNTYSCIKNRGISACAKQVVRIIQRHKEAEHLYCLKIDLRKYYPSINHDVLKVIIRKKLKDPDVLWLLDDIIDSEQGLPIGNYSSQALANLYLCYFMHWVNEVLKVEAVEFADDIPFFSTDKNVLHETLRNIRNFLEGELKLTIKDNWQIFPIARHRHDKHGRALDFIGFKFYREQILLRKCIKHNLCAKAAELNKRDISGKEYRIAISPWLGWAKASNSKHLLKTIIKHKDYESIIR